MSELEDLKDALHEAFDSTHILDLEEVGWSVQHSLACRRGKMTDCSIHRYVFEFSDELHDDYGPGRYFIYLGPDGEISIADVHDDFVDPIERVRQMLGIP